VIVANRLAEEQIGFPKVAIVFCQTRKLAQEYTYRYLATATTAVLTPRSPPLRRGRGGIGRAGPTGTPGSP
jgi:hypothetical protein